MQKSLEEITEKWKKLKVELTSLETMLKAVIQYWSRFTSCVDLIRVGFDDIETIMKTSWSGAKVNIELYHCNVNF